MPPRGPWATDMEVANPSNNVVKSNKKYQSGHIPGPGTYDLNGTGNKNGCK